MNIYELKKLIKASDDLNSVCDQVRDLINMEMYAPLPMEWKAEYMDALSSINYVNAKLLGMKITACLDNWRFSL